ncbi:MAG: hypothetical protein HC851_17520 [Acaryochloris sp. RU_4_1]|nr:hypothetical protein [Acaryochloris sp. RU_4_1]NJR57233.1 hypothetical protein [Acaryochloris sp. CRU_2_0]
MAKRKITDLLNDELSNSVSSKITEFRSSKVPDGFIPKDEDLAIPKMENRSSITEPQRQANRLTEFENDEVPKYLQMERKEVRLPQEHLDKLTLLVRQLNRARKRSGERITENTLIRIAIAGMIEHADQLKGTTEDELLVSWTNYVNSK